MLGASRAGPTSTVRATPAGLAEWQLGDTRPEGALRSRADETAFSQPDRLT